MEPTYPRTAGYVRPLNVYGAREVPPNGARESETPPLNIAIGALPCKIYNNSPTKKFFNVSSFQRKIFVLLLISKAFNILTFFLALKKFKNWKNRLWFLKFLFLCTVVQTKKWFFFIIYFSKFEHYITKSVNHYIFSPLKKFSWEMPGLTRYGGAGAVRKNCKVGGEKLQLHPVKCNKNSFSIFSRRWGEKVLCYNGTK